MSVMINMEKKVPASPYCTIFYTSFLCINITLTLRFRLRVILGIIVIWEIIISPLPILANIAKVYIRYTELKDNRKTSGKFVINMSAPMIYISIYKLIPSIQFDVRALQILFFLFSFA